MTGVNRRTNNIKEYLESEKGNKELNDFVRRMQEIERRKKEMIETDYYVKWLEAFTETYPRFTDSTWLYHSDKISEDDNKNVESLDKFFNAIEEFADKHYIPYAQCENGISYYIKYNEKIYEIGLIVGQGAVCYCNTIGIDNSVISVDFEEFAMPKDKTLIRTSLIENQLQRIEDLLKQIYSSSLNMPLYAIQNRVQKVLEELKEKK